MVLSRPTLASPGVADYQVRLKNQAGEYVAIFDTWRSLYFSHLVNSPGVLRFEIEGNDDRISLFELDGQIEVWRRNTFVDLDWYIEWEGFARSPVRQTFVDGDKSYTSYASSYLHLMTRRRILYFSGTDFSGKTDAGETVMKSYADENAGPGANNANRQRDGVFFGLSIEGNAGLGPTWTGRRAWDNLLDVLKDISFDVSIDFDVVGIGAATFEFRTYLGQRGADRTVTGLVPTTGLNGAGNVPIIFSLTFDNMAVPSFSEQRTGEVTIAVALGRGEGSERNVQIVESADRLNSPWNDIEDTRNASQETTDAGLVATANSLLVEKGKNENFSFEVIQLLAQYYGKDYTWGDLVTARYDEIERNKKLIELSITVSQGAEGNVGEEINMVFGDVV